MARSVSGKLGTHRGFDRGETVTAGQANTETSTPPKAASAHSLTTPKTAQHPLTTPKVVQRERGAAGGSSSDGWESFFHRHQYTISAIEAFSTSAAIIVSLALALLARRTSRTQAKVFAQISAVHHLGLDGVEPQYITANVLNAGLHPLSVPFSFFHWRIPLQWEEPFNRKGWSVVPWDYSQEDPVVPQKHYPVVINPRSSETFFLSDMQTFRDQMLKIFAGANMLQRFRFRYIGGRFLSDDGRFFDVKLSEPLRELLRELLTEATAAH